MASLNRVTGAGFDGSTVSLSFGKQSVRCVKASYGDKLEPAFESYMGSQEQDEQSPGTYKTDELKVTMTSAQFRLNMVPNFPTFGGGNVRMSIVVNRNHPDLGSDSDLLEGCRCVNWTAAVENSNKLELTELVFTVQQIKWTNDRKTINQLRVLDLVPVGNAQSNF